MSEEIRKFQDKYHKSASSKTFVIPPKIPVPPKQSLSEAEVESRLRFHILNIFKNRDPINDPLTLVNLELKLQRTYSNYLKKELWTVIRKLIDDNIIVQNELKFGNFEFVYQLQASDETIEKNEVVKITELPKETLPEKDDVVVSIKKTSVDIDSVSKPVDCPVVVSMTVIPATTYLTPEVSKPVKTQSGPRKKLVSTESFTDEQILDYLRPGTRHTKDLTVLLNVTQPTASRRLRKLTEEGKIFKTSFHAPWSVKFDCSKLDLPKKEASVKEEAVILSSPETKPAIQNVAHPDSKISIEFNEVGYIVLSGLCNHERILLTNEEMIYLFEAVTRSPIDKIKAAVLTARLNKSRD